MPTALQADEKLCAPGRIRTGNPRSRNPARYPLRYQMRYPPNVHMDFSKPAFDVVMDKLKASAIPPRLLD